MTTIGEPRIVVQTALTPEEAEALHHFCQHTRQSEVVVVRALLTEALRGESGPLHDLCQRWRAGHLTH